jgi:uncharacterized protein (DUF305 family)
MTTATDRPTEADDPESVGAPAGARSTRALVSIAAVALLVVAVTAGFLWGRHTGTSSTSAPSSRSVDAGFAWDMSTHHGQAITMAGYARDYTDDPEIKLLAYDIEDQQAFQVGEMHGWLDEWGLSAENPSPMSWMSGHAHMSSNGFMPGMATPAQMTELKSLTGKALDIYFLQLMIHHHQGGIPMAQYAQQHAKEPFVRDLAQAMINAQSSEIVAMEQVLRKLGGAPLPAPEQ